MTERKRAIARERDRARLSALAPTEPAIAQLLDLLGHRWALRILWELRGGTLSSRGLAARCGGVSPTVLHKRLAELRGALLVVLRRPGGHALSPDGAGLVELLLPGEIEAWAGRWAPDLSRKTGLLSVRTGGRRGGAGRRGGRC